MKHAFSRDRSWLEQIDRFGVGVSIRFNKQRFHNTSCGGIVTIAIFGFMFYNVVLIASELIQQLTPQVIQQTNYITGQAPVQLTPEKFTLALGLQDQNYVHFIDESIYTIYARQNQQIRFQEEDGNQNFKLIYTEVKMEPCTSENFQVPGSESYFNSLPYKYIYCVSLDQEYPTIQGEFSEDRFSQFEIFFKRCENTTLSQNCSPPDVIDAKLRMTTLGSYISNYQVSITNLDDPFFSNGQNLFWSTGTGMEKDIWLSLMNTKIESDKGRIFKDVTTQETLVYSSNREIVLPATSSLLYYLTIVYEKNKELVYTRTYMKINTAFSQVGGLFNFLFFLGYSLCRPFAQLKLSQKVINEIFSFKKPNCKSSKQSKEEQGGSGSDSSVTDSQTNTKVKKLRIEDIQNERTFKQKLQSNQTDKQCHRSSVEDRISQSNLDYDNNKDTSTNKKVKVEIIKMVKNPLSPTTNIFSSNVRLTSQNMNQSGYTQQQSQVIKFGAEEYANSPLPSLSPAEYKAKKQNLGLTKNQRQPNNIINRLRQDQEEGGDDLPQKKFPRKSQDQSVNQKQSSDGDQKAENLEDKSYKINLWDYFMSYFHIFRCLQTPKQKVVQYSTESILKHLDLFNILRKLIELEKLKRLLLTDNQIKLFEYLPKPILDADEAAECDSEEQYIDQQEDIKKIIGLLSVETKESERINQVEEAYRNIKYQQENPSVFDQKLIEMLDNKVKVTVDKREETLIQAAMKNKQEVSQQPPPPVNTLNTENNQENNTSKRVRSEKDAAHDENRQNGKQQQQQQQLAKIPSKFKITSERNFDEYLEHKENQHQSEENGNNNNIELESCLVNSLNLNEDYSPNPLKRPNKDFSTINIENLNELHSPGRITNQMSAMLIPQSAQFFHNLSSKSTQNKSTKNEVPNKRSLQMMTIENDNTSSSVLEPQPPTINLNLQKV